MARRSASTQKETWEDPKIEPNLKVKSTVIIGRIIAHTLKSGNLLIIVSTRYTSLWITEYNIMNDKYQQITLTLSSRINMKHKYALSEGSNYNKLILVQTVFDNRPTQDHMFIIDITKQTITKARLFRPAHFKVFSKNPQFISFNGCKVLIYCDSDGLVNGTSLNVEQHRLDYFPSNKNGLISFKNNTSFKINDRNQTLSAFSVFDDTAMIIVDPDFKDCVCMINKDKNSMDMIPLITKQQEIEDRFRNCERYRIFNCGKWNLIWIIMDEKIKRHPRTTIMYLNITKREWMICDGNVKPELDGIFLERTQEIISCDLTDKCYCIGNWSENENSIEKFHVSEINMMDLLSEKDKKEMERDTKYLIEGFNRLYTLEYKLNVPIAISRICIKYYDIF